MSDIKHICRVCGHTGQSCLAIENAVRDMKGPFVAQCSAFALADDLKPGTVWRKQGPYDWIRIESIQDPALPESYDGGIPGVAVIQFPCQEHGIQLRGGKRCFVAGADWPEQVRRNRFVLAPGWKRGDKISIIDKEKESNKSCKNCKRVENCAGNDSGIFPCPDYKKQ
jgi:hypothetical protein